MKSRFDQDKYWFTSDDTVLLSEMSTAHLYNIYVMFTKHPERILPMLLQDFDTPEKYNQITPWRAGQESDNNVITQSVWTASSMSQAELIHYVYTSSLGRALTKELKSRGVNLETTNKDLNILTLTDEQLNNCVN